MEDCQNIITIGHIQMHTLTSMFCKPKTLNLMWNSPHNHSVHPPSFLEGGGEVEPPTEFSKRGDLTGPQLLEVGCWESGGDFFQGVLQFSHKK